MRIFAVDIEASGFHGWPIEIGWSLVGSGSFRSLLIKPDPSWSMDLWDDCAEDLHGLSIETLLAEGRPISEVADAFLTDAADATLVSDAPEFDQFWLDQLFDASYLFTTKEGRVVLQSIHSVFSKFDPLKFENETESRKNHRAGPDALELSNHLHSITSQVE